MVSSVRCSSVRSQFRTHADSLLHLGVPIQMPNGTFSAVFSQEALDVAESIGARPVSSLQAHTNMAKV
eukprot:COSAG05_NODE_435_length_9845_cov_24.433364_4_plen_68_part_00